MQRQSKTELVSVPSSAGEGAGEGHHTGNIHFENSEVWNTKIDINYFSLVISAGIF